MYLFQKFPPAIELFKKNGLTWQWFSCNLCLGVWVYWATAFIFRVNIFPMFYIPVVSEFINGAVASFLVHVFSVGFADLFSVYEVN